MPAPRFAIDDRAITSGTGQDVEIRDRTYDGGQWSYRVRGNTGINMYVESRLEPIAALDLPDDWVQGERESVARFGATLTRTKLRGKFADTIYSFRATRTVFRPYQFKPVLKLLTPILRPLYAWNHRWAMARGLEGLRRELVRRRGGAAAMETASDLLPSQCAFEGHP